MKFKFMHTLLAAIYMGDDDKMYLRLVSPELRDGTWAVAEVESGEACLRQLSAEMSNELTGAEVAYAKSLAES